MPKLLSAFLFLLIFSAPSYALTCGQSVVTLLEKLSEKHVDLDAIRYESHIVHDANQFTYQLQVFDQKTTIAQMNIDILGSPSVAEVRGAFLVDRENYLGTGFGSYLYIVTAKDVFETTGQLLTRSAHPSKLAQKAWENLTENGMVKNGQFLPSALKSPNVEALYQRFLKTLRVLPQRPSP